MVKNAPRTVGVDDVLNWLRQREDLALQVAEVNARIGELTRKIEAAKVLFPEIAEEVSPVDAALDTDAASVRTWSDLVRYALSRATGGRTQAQILHVGRNTAIGDRVRKGPNPLYATVKRMEERGEIMRKGEYLYLPTLLSAIERGAVKDEMVASDRQPKGAPANAVFRCLADGIPRYPKDIAESLKHDPATSKQVNGNPSYIYTLLGRMVDRKQLIKNSAGKYMLAPEANEPPNGSPVGGSNASADLYSALSISQPASSKAH